MDFVRKLYRGKNCYSDSLTSEEIELIHIMSTTEIIISQMLEDKKIIFLTGNPGDGKTYIIKALDAVINKVNAYVETDLSSIEDYSDMVYAFSILLKMQKYLEILVMKVFSEFLS